MPVEQGMNFMKMTQAYQKTMAKKPLKWTNNPTPGMTTAEAWDYYYGHPPSSVLDTEPESKSATDRALETLLKDTFDEKDIEVLRSFALQAIRMATTARTRLKKLEEENIEILNRINEPEEDL